MAFAARGTLLDRAVNSTTAATTMADQSFQAWLGMYWYVLLIVIALLVVVSVLICACVLHKHPRMSTNPQQGSKSFIGTPWSGSSNPQQSPQRSLPVTNSSSISEESIPLPSHYSSTRHSLRPSSRSQRRSPHPSALSGDSDTIRPDTRSVSSGGSSASLMGRNSRQLDHQRMRPHRTHSSPIIQVVSELKSPTGALYNAPSTLSVGSSGSGQSGVSYRFNGSSDDGHAFVEVGVTVHTSSDPEQAVSVTAAAALAESARKLAQEAANFIDEEEETRSQMRLGMYRGDLSHPHHRQYYSSGRRSSAHSLPPHHSHHTFTRPASSLDGSHQTNAKYSLDHMHRGRRVSLDMPAGRRSRFRPGLEEELRDPYLNIPTTSEELRDYLHSGSAASFSTHRSSLRSPASSSSSSSSHTHTRHASYGYLRKPRHMRDRYNFGGHNSVPSFSLDDRVHSRVHHPRLPTSNIQTLRNAVLPVSDTRLSEQRVELADSTDGVRLLREVNRLGSDMYSEDLLASDSHKKSEDEIQAYKDNLEDKQEQIGIVVEATVEGALPSKSLSRSPSTGMLSQSEASHHHDNEPRHYEKNSELGHSSLLSRTAKLPAKHHLPAHFHSTSIESNFNKLYLRSSSYDDQHEELSSDTPAIHTTDNQSTSYSDLIHSTTVTTVDV